VAGDKVRYTTQVVSRGILAKDVHKASSDEGLFDLKDRLRGTIKIYFPDRGFGFIRSDTISEAIYFHRSDVGGDVVPVPDLITTFRLADNDSEPHAQDLLFESTDAASEAHNWLAQAILARDSRQLDHSANLYEKGLRLTPSVQLVLSYAAMEKNRNRKQAAMRIYREGIRLFPQNAKLHEDAGVLAASLGDYARALTLLEDALRLCRSTQQGGEKGVLLALARTHYSIDTIGSLADAIKRYEEALRVFGQGATRLPEYDLLAMNLAKIRTQHHRGNVTVQFLRSVRFEIVRARLLEQSTEGAEFVVRVDNPEFKESYGLAGHLIIRSMFKANVSLADLQSLDQSVARWSESGLGDERVALLVVSSLPTDLQRLLARRIEDRRQSLPALVPLQQTEVETSQ
jgi:tetratricopeptide (TPR) repeat protein